MKVGVLLSGNGVYDGSEIHESVLTLLVLDQLGAETFCIAPDIEQHHVINHLNGEEMNEKRNVLTEAARIARGNIKDLSKVSASDMDALALPGGFGVAKNLSKWAFEGPDGAIDDNVKRVINEVVSAGKPIGALCMAPTTLAKALEGSGVKADLTVGNTEESSPYEIEAISQGIGKAGAQAVMCKRTEMVVDDVNGIITTPCYMMDNSISDVYEGIRKTMTKLVEMVALNKES